MESTFTHHLMFSVKNDIPPESIAGFRWTDMELAHCNVTQLKKQLSLLRKPI